MMKPALTRSRCLGIFFPAVVCLCLATSHLGCGRGGGPSGDPISVEELNRAIGVAAMSPSGMPRTVDELTNFPGFQNRPLPEPPPGKRFVINPATRSVVAVDE
jgi:hypothetical protein